MAIVPGTFDDGVNNRVGEWKRKSFRNGFLRLLFFHDEFRPI